MAGSSFYQAENPTPSATVTGLENLADSVEAARLHSVASDESADTSTAQAAISTAAAATATTKAAEALASKVAAEAAAAAAVDTISDVTDEGTEQIALVAAAGTTQIGLVAAQGVTSIAAVEASAESEVDAAIAPYIVQVEAARDAAFGNANVYGSTALGLAAVSSGTQFQVIEDDEAVRYEDTAGVAVEKASLPTSLYIDRATAHPNMFLAGKYPDDAGFIYATQEVDDIVSPELIALGFTRGVVKIAADSRIIYGDFMSFKPRGNEYYFARVYVQKDAGSANFGSAQKLYFFKDSGQTMITSGGAGIAMSLEQTISSTAAVYSVSGQLTSAFADADVFGVGVDVGTGTGLSITGGQFAISSRRIRSIPTDDYPNERPFNLPILSDNLYLTAGRPLPIYLESCLKRRGAGQAPMVLAFQSVKGSGVDFYPYQVEGTRQLIIDPDKCGATGLYDVRTIPSPGGLGGDYHKSYRKTVTVGITAASGITKSPKILMLGDSTANRGGAFIVKERMQAAGITPTFLGTIATGNRTATSSGGPDSEVREGRGLMDYAGNASAHAFAITPVALGDEAAYLAMTRTNRITYNPFRSTGNFDMPEYLSRFSIATPDIVTIGLGLNDVGQQLAVDLDTFLADYEDAFDIIQTSCRAVGANLKIGWWLPNMAHAQFGDYRYDTKYAAVLELLLRKVREVNEANTKLISVWAHQTINSGWDLVNDPVVDAATGWKHAKIADYLHPKETPRELAFEALANYCKFVAP